MFGQCLTVIVAMLLSFKLTICDDIEGTTWEVFIVQFLCLVHFLEHFQGLYILLALSSLLVSASVLALYLDLLLIWLKGHHICQLLFYTTSNFSLLCIELP